MKLIVCLPGNNFSGNFIDAWTILVSYFLKSGINFMLSRKESCNIYYVRNMCLGANILRGRFQKPFDGKIEYDYILFIDSDNLPRPQDFQRLINHNKDIVAGMYLMENGTEYAVVQNWDIEFFEKYGHFKFLSVEDIKKNKLVNFLGTDENGLLKVSYCGMGCMLIKYGVFESMEYPGFKQIEQKIGDNIVDMTMEDVAFCLTAREKGFDVWVDINTIVGHEKKFII